MRKFLALFACATTLLAASCVNDELYEDLNDGHSGGGTENPTPAPAEYKGLVLNELNGNDKFIELYNKGAEAIALKGVYIEKDKENVWEADDITLEAGAYLLLYSEDVIADKHPEYDGSGLVFASGLSAKKAVRVQLFAPSGESIDDFNLVDYSTPAPASYSRCPDGTGPWTYAAATPNAVNAQSTTLVKGLEGYEDEAGDTNGDNGDDDNGGYEGDKPTISAASLVVINEIDGNAKFVEIYNNGTTEVSLAGYKLVKNEEETVWTGADNVTLAAGEYIVLYSNKADNVADVDASLVFSAGLSPKQTLKIELLNALSESVDIFTRGSQPWGEALPENKKASFSRVPNGTGEWAYATPTPDAANGAKIGDIEQE